MTSAITFKSNMIHFIFWLGCNILFAMFNFRTFFKDMITEKCITKSIMGLYGIVVLLSNSTWLYLAKNTVIVNKKYSESYIYI